MVSFLADSSDEQDRAEPRNGPSTTPDDRIKAVQTTRGLTTGNDTVISLRNYTRYRDTKSSHDSSPKILAV